ncbi:MAG: hypothetical protein ACK4SA_11000 [Caldilinea sp.]
MNYILWLLCEVNVKSIPKTILETPIAGVNLSADTLRQELGATPTVLIFLRHFG